MYIGELYSDEELKLEAKISEVRELINICNSDIKTTEGKIRELCKTCDDNKIMLQMLDKKADRLTGTYLNLNDQLSSLLNQIGEDQTNQ